ncbi:hypothetical protein [Undibacterium sp.]|uniref:hypothetical protein n=1 Tax=Undibacterium sp. TaxID=1914977 RepID=UPI00374D516B
MSGPPGAGKTSLVGSYLEARGNPVLWYHVDRNDLDPAYFFSCFDEALTTLCQRSPSACSKFFSGQILDFPLFCSAYFRDAYEYLPTRCTIVLDDYHLAAGEALEHAAKALITEAPAETRVFFTSRTPAPSFLARERANRRLAVVDWDMLKFDTEEISSLCLAAGVQTGADPLLQLSRKTQGWAAGIVLLLERAKTSKALDWTFSPANSPETIFHYFAEEIFALETAGAQRILLSLAFLPQYTQQMMAYMTDEPVATTVAEDLCSKNFFIDRHGGEEGTYQFHALFREFLQSKTRSICSAAELQQLHRKSAAMLEQAGDFNAAIELYRLLDDFPRTTHIIESQAERLFSCGLGDTVSRWMQQLPFEWIDERPVLQYWLAKTERLSNPQRARQLLEQAYPGFAANGDYCHQVAAASDILRCYLQQGSGFRGADTWSLCLQGLLVQHVADLPRPLIADACCNLLSALSLGCFQAQSRAQSQHRQHRQLRQLQQHSLGDPAAHLSSVLHEELAPDLKIRMATSLLDHYAWQCQFSICEELMAYARPLLALPDVAPLSLALYGTVKLHYLASVPDYAGAKAEFDMLSQSMPDSRQPFPGVAMHVNYLSACLAGGHLQEADALIDSLEHRLEPRRSMDVMMLHFVKSWRSLLYGDVAKAKMEVERMLAPHLEMAACRNHVQGLAALATINAIAGEHDAVAAILNEERGLFAGMASPLLDFHLSLLQAYLHLDAGQRAACHLSLEAAFSLARREGLLTTIFWVPDLVAPLCAEALDAGIEAEYVIRLIRARQLKPPARSYMPGWPWPVEIRALGSFEIRIAGEPLQFAHKAQRKPLELLRLLIAQGGRNVSAEKAADALWPDSDGDAAQNSFDSALYRLRKLLKHDDVIMLSEGRLSLNHSLCWLDIWALDKLADEVAASPSVKKLSSYAAQLFRIYRGPLFSADMNLPGQSQASINHRSKFERCLMDLCSIFQSMGKMGLAIELLEQGLENDGEAKLLPMLLRDLKKHAGER